eukprot:gene5287-8905_t
MGRAYESGRCFRDYGNFHKSVSCNSTHVTYHNECDSNCQNCLGVVSKIRGSCAPGHNNPAAGFSEKYKCSRQLPHIAQKGFLFKSFSNSRCQGLNKPVIFVQDDYCYSQSQNEVKDNFKSITFGSVRMFWNREKRVASFMFFSGVKCQGNLKRTIEVSPRKCTPLDDYYIIVGK